MLKKFLTSMSFSGRLRRSGFIFNATIWTMIFFVLFVFMETMFGRATTWLLYPPLFLIAATLMVRRLHDDGRSAWWLLLLLIPLFGPIFIAFVLLFRKGNKGENHYGLDPRETGAGYLSVDIHAQGPVK
jgi:uncharacterized membrane protein YhaH (DUF805 family)